ncbi:MAG: sulfotransferase domain-containing protein [Ardenticatenaceae bacterium]|nr:sulfotransferase domain-containing protein [Ardenticatenaceae bacterium]
MMRSGSTLQYQITKDIVETSGTGYALGWIETEDFPMLHKRYEQESRNIVAKTHAYIDGIGEMIIGGEAKAIYVHRDIRDVTVSLMNKRNKSFWYILLTTPFIELVLENHRNWTAQTGILISRYEEMVANLKQEVLRIASYLNVPLGEVEAAHIASKYALERQIAKVKQLETQDEDSVNMMDSELLFHRNHIHSGDVGQWANTLTKFQVGVVEALVKDKLRTSENYEYGVSVSPAIIYMIKALNKVVVPIKGKGLSLRERFRR